MTDTANKARPVALPPTVLPGNFAGIRWNQCCRQHRHALDAAGIAWQPQGEDGKDASGEATNDIVARLRAEAAREPEVGELMDEAADEVERLRLTDAEREAIEAAVAFFSLGYGTTADTLRELLERMRPK